MAHPRLTIQFCTYNRAALLRRVLRGCFEQTVPDYEVVVVNDGSTDETESVLEEAARIATVAFRYVSHRNRGLARSRNVGLEMARGQRILFIDDDVLPTPNLVEEHLRRAARSPRDIVRGAVILTPSFDRLPAPFWSLRDYSANFFWTSNVSVPAETLIRLGGFNETFCEYGWEDLEFGLRLRRAGLRSHFHRDAVVFHYKAPITAEMVPKMLDQARAQARTAVAFGQLHANWRVPLATGDDPVQRGIDRLFRALGRERRLQRLLEGSAPGVPLSAAQRRAVRGLCRHAYYAELERARALHAAW